MKRNDYKGLERFKMTKLKVDFHTHPLGHIHYSDVVTTTRMEEYEKDLVQEMIRIGIRRGLDAIALTDHNDFRAGLYGSAWGQEHGLPIRVIPGAELSVVIEGEEIHILAIGTKEAINFNPYDDFDLTIQAIHDVEGLAILAHPHYYPYVFPMLKEYLDGVEFYNGVNAALHPHDRYFKKCIESAYVGLKLFGSDHHLPYELRAEQLEAVTIVDEKMMNMLGGIFE